MPKRIQLRRTKGWRKPAGAVVVARPGVYGNCYRIGDSHPYTGEPMTRADTVALFRAAVLDPVTGAWWRYTALPKLRGKDLACWCPLDQPCHADVLLELANA